MELRKIMEHYAQKFVLIITYNILIIKNLKIE
jgi:hypothetical protein